MKLQIDTVAKTIKLEQSAKIVEFISLVKKLLPNDWKDYSIEAVAYIYNWYNPITIPSVWYGSPTEQPYTLTTTDSAETFCVETKN